MTPAQHAPGPWTAIKVGRTMTEGYSQPFGVYSGEPGQEGANLICGCFGDGQGGVESAEANANLIAAAPDLLEALTQCLPYVARYESEHMSNVALDVYSTATAAIAKVTCK